MSKSPRRVPVRLVDKIIIIGNIRVSTDAIHLCAENQIPILFAAKDHTEKAILLPYNHKLPQHYKEQRIILQSSETLRRYKKWIYTRTTVARLDVLKALFSGFNFPSEIGDGNYQFIINKFKSNKPYWDTVQDIVTNFIRAVLAGKIIKAGLDIHLGIIHRRVNFGLLLDLCIIFEPEADFQTVRFYKEDNLEKMFYDGKLSETGIKNIIDRFESRRQYISNTAETVIDELFEIIKDVRK